MLKGNSIGKKRLFHHQLCCDMLGIKKSKSNIFTERLHRAPKYVMQIVTFPKGLQCAMFP